MTFQLHHVSHSAANRFLECGERYRLERVEHHYGLPHLASIGGSAFHSWTEEWDLMMNLGRFPVVPSYETFFTMELQDAAEKHYRKTGEELSVDDIPHSRGENDDWWIRKGNTMTEMYVQWRESTGWVAAEIEYSYEQELGLSVPAVGFIDREFVREDGARVLVDLKTSKKLPQTPQLFEYAVIRRLQGIQIDYVAYYDARRGILTEPVSPLDHTVTWLKQYYGNVVSKIQAGVFKPNPGVHCRWCPVREHCVFDQYKK